MQQFLATAGWSIYPILILNTLGLILSMFHLWKPKKFSLSPSIRLCIVAIAMVSLVEGFRKFIRR